MDEEQGIYRGEVIAMMGALADIQEASERLLRERIAMAKAELEAKKKAKPA